VETTIRLALPDTLNRTVFLDKITDHYNTIPESPDIFHRSYYDTFDWRLYKKGLLLCRGGRTYQLLSQNHVVTASATIASHGTKPRYWWDFPVGPLQHQLRALLGVRALLHLATLKTEVHGKRLLNSDQKTVLHIRHEDVFITNSKAESHLQRAVVLCPMRGYPDELRKFRLHLESLSINNEAADPFLAALKTVGVKPGSYTSKLNIALAPDMSARAAARRIFFHLLRTLRQNEKGIKADIDTEFLHDYRVAIRRTRSALTQFKGVFPAQATEQFKQDFAYLGKLTNRLRDLDVYLLKRQEYCDLLPERLRPALDSLFQNLATERRDELKKFILEMDTDNYRGTLAQWERFLADSKNEVMEPSTNSSIHALNLAQSIIYKRFKKIIKIGKRIHAESPDKELHRLRIECKKLRYSLEFFTSLFPKQDLDYLVKQLKKLQDNLGDFNDLHVQQVNLSQYLTTIKGVGARTVLQAAAVGGLITQLNTRQHEVRRSFTKSFQLFSSPENIALFKKLFH